MAAIKIRKGNKEKKELPEKKAAVESHAGKSVQIQLNELRDLVLNLVVHIEKSKSG